MGLMAGEMEAGRGWRPTVRTMCPPWPPPPKLCKYSISSWHPDLHAPSSHRLFLLPLPTPHSHLLLVSSSDTLLPRWTPGVLLSSSQRLGPRPFAAMPCPLSLPRITSGRSRCWDMVRLSQLEARRWVKIHSLPHSSVSASAPRDS